MIRTGFGINYDPYPLAFARDMLTNYPEELLLTVNPTVATDGPATQFKDGIPPIQVPDLSSGHVSVRVQYATRSLPDKVVRGYIESWNFSLQKQIQGGWMAQAAYVGSRQLKINERLGLNAGQVLDAGTAGQPYFVKFARTTATELLTPVGHNKYDSLQTSLQRRVSRGVSVNFNYTFSKALGICCDDLADGYPSIQIPEYMRLNRAVMPYDRTHTFGAAFLMEAPFGRGKKWLSSGIASKLAGGWRFNGLIAVYSGQPFTVTSNTPLNAPNISQRASLAKSSITDSGRDGSESIVLRSVRVYAERYEHDRHLGSRRGARPRLRINGQDQYLYRALDSTGQTIDFLLTAMLRQPSDSFVRRCSTQPIPSLESSTWTRTERIRRPWRNSRSRAHSGGVVGYGCVNT